MISDVAATLIVDLAEAVAITGTGHVPGVTVTTVWPDQLRVPTILVGASEPYVTPGQFRGDYEVHLDATILVSKDRDQLDKLITTVLAATEMAWGVTSVSAPSRVTIDATDYLGAVITVANQTKL